MTNVYFEAQGYNELAVSFEEDELYLKCLPQLEEYAKDHGFDKVTESMDND